MKKIILFLFALALGVGISTAFASGMQPPGHDEVITVSTVVLSNEMPAPAIMNVVNQEVLATYQTYSQQNVLIDVESGSSGGIADGCVLTRETKLQPLNWRQTADPHRAMVSDQPGCTQKKYSNAPVYSITCNYRFLLI